MNNSNLGITKENLMLIVPPALTHDPSIMALAEAAAETLADRLAETERLKIYAAINLLDEELLDILARDFKVDWWDANYSLEEKRRTLKDSWRVHRMKGTKAAVEMAIRAIYPESHVEEWFEYGGEPYYFKLHIDLSGVKGDETRPWMALERVGYYKSLRSHIEKIEFTMKPKEPLTLRLGGGFGSCVTLPVPEAEDKLEAETTLHIGGGVGAYAKIPVPQAGDDFTAETTLHTGGTTAIRSTMPVPENTLPPPSFSILRTGGVCTIISNLSGG